MTEARLAYFQIPPDPPDPDVVKRYRAYLTRLSKWLGVKLADDKTSIVRAADVRSEIIKRGDLAIHLDESWAKRVFSDKDLFEDAQGGFWKVLVGADDEGAPSHPSKWEGVRPGEDVSGAALTKMVDGLGRLTPRPELRCRWLDSDAWQLTHQFAVVAMEYAKRRGVERPLALLQERAFREACLDEDYGLQAAAIWLTNTRVLVEGHARLVSVLKKEEGAALQSDDLFIIRDVMCPPEENTPEIAVKFARRHLLERGILHGKKP